MEDFCSSAPTLPLLQKDDDAATRVAEELRVTKAKRADLEVKCTALQSEVAFFERENARLASEVS